MKACMIAIGVLLVLAVSSTRAWRDGALDTKWDFDCDFYGNDVGRMQTEGENCGLQCHYNDQCTHFTWRDQMCYLKRNENYWRANHAPGAVCGFIEGRSKQD